jgi:hypothetical protein
MAKKATRAKAKKSGAVRDLPTTSLAASKAASVKGGSFSSINIGSTSAKIESTASSQLKFVSSPGLIR